MSDIEKKEERKSHHVIIPYVKWLTRKKKKS